MILKDVGEVGIHKDEITYILKPSLYSISKLGSPTEIVELSSLIFNEPNRMIADQILTCCTDEDISEIIGYYTDDGEGKLKYVDGLMSLEEKIIIAQTLILHGVIGANDLKDYPKDERADDPDFIPKFDCKMHVANAMAHLGLNEEDAWNMTMTSLVSALIAKYPPLNNTPDLTIEEAEKVEEWFDNIKSERK